MRSSARHASIRSALLASALALTAACAGSDASRPDGPRTGGDRAAAADPQSLMRAMIAQTPSTGRELGMHEYDGKIADHSEAGIRARIAFLEDARARLEALGPGVTPDAELDRRLALQAAEEDLFELTELETWRTRPDFYGELFGVDAYIVRDYAPLEQRAAAMLGHLRAAKPQVAHIRRNLRSPLSQPVVKTAIDIYQGHAEYLRGDVQTFLAKVADPQLRAAAQAAALSMAAEAEAIGRHLEQVELPRADQSHVLGRERYERLLQVQEALTTPIEELEKMAAEDLARNKAAWEALAPTVEVGRPTAGNLMVSARKVVADSRTFMLDKKIVTMPGEDAVKVEETPPFMRWNSAFLNGPGPFDAATLPAYYYITLPDPKWPAHEQEAYVMTWGDLIATSVHEVFAGHYVQGLWQRNAPTFVQKVTWSYSFGEGWAHYVEQMMVDEGFGAADPQTRLGQLGNALLRNCRFVASIGIHVRGMSVEEAKRRFVEDCKQSEPEARQQAVRGTFDPGYFAYTLGKLQILQLREEARQKLGARFHLGRFHDALLAHGAPPVPLIRDRVLEAIGAR